MYPPKPVLLSDKQPSYPELPDPVRVIRWASASSERLILPARQNDLFMITWITKGKGLLTIDLSSEPFERDQLFIIRPGTVWGLDTEKMTGLEGWSLSIKENYLHEYGSNLSGLIFELHNITNLKIPEENRQKMAQLFYFLQTELPAGSPEAAVVVNSYLTILLSEFKKLSGDPSAHRTLHDPRYEEFLEMMNKEFREIKDIGTYAARVYISSKQLNRICKEVTGRTAAQLLEERIHLEASRLLHYTNRSIKDISYELGFGQPAYFIKFYRRISNKTPHQYRQLLSGKHPGLSGDQVRGSLSLPNPYDN